MMYKVNFQNKTRKKNKYNAKGREYNGRWYDSNKEAKYAEELDWLKMAGEIKEIIPQFKIPITVNGVFIANYYMDFKVITSTDGIEFHEVKGFETEVWRLKWKLCQALKDEIEPGAEWIIIK